MKNKIVVDIYVDNDCNDICSAECDGIDLKEAIRKGIASCTMFSDDMGYPISLEPAEIDGYRCFRRCLKCLAGEHEYDNCCDKV